MKIFTGQTVVDGDKVSCHKCKELIILTSSAWFDPYVGGKKGKYVHFGCLSDKRKQEIANTKSE
jgi:hypothetical protein